MRDSRMDGVVKKSFMVYIAVLLAFMVLATVVSTWNLSVLTTRELRNERLDSVEQANRQIDEELRKIDRDVISFCDQAEVYKFVNNTYADELEKQLELVKLQNMFVTFTKYNELIDSIYLYSDITGQVLTNQSTAPIASFADTGWYEDFRNSGDRAAWKPSREIGGQYFVTLLRSFPLMSSDLRRGAVVVNVNEDKLLSVLKSYAGGSREEGVFILDKDANILSASNKRRIREPFSFASFEENGPNSDVETVHVDGTKYIMFHSVSEYTKWRVVSLEPQRDVFMARNANLSMMVAIMVGMILLATLMLVHFNRKTRRRVGQYVDSLETRIKENISTVKLRFTLDLLAGTPMEPENLRNHLDLLNIELFPDLFVVLLIRFPGREYITPEIMENVDGLVDISANGLSVVIEQNTVACILSFAERNEADVREQYLCSAEYLRAMLVYEFDQTVTIGIGLPAHGYDNIYQSYNQALGALKYQAVMEENSIICYDDVRHAENDAVYNVSDSIGKITMLLDKKNYSAVRSEISTLYRNIYENKLSEDYIRQFTLSIALELMRRLKETGVPEEEWGGGLSGKDVYSSLADVRKIKDFEAYLMSLAAPLEKHNSQKTDAKIFNEIIEAIIEYVDENFTDPDLSLSGLADRFGLSVSYLSRLFRSSTGKTFIEYMIEKRVEEAKRLLRETRMKVGEVGQRVGYVNYISFVRIFKKYTGTNPSEFRNATI